MKFLLRRKKIKVICEYEDRIIKMLKINDYNNNDNDNNDNNKIKIWFVKIVCLS